jgi:hypothetical protein
LILTFNKKDKPLCCFKSIDLRSFFRETGVVIGCAKDQDIL